MSESALLMSLAVAAGGSSLSISMFSVLASRSVNSKAVRVSPLSGDRIVAVRSDGPLIEFWVQISIKSWARSIPCGGILPQTPEHIFCKWYCLPVGQHAPSISKVMNLLLSSATLRGASGTSDSTGCRHWCVVFCSSASLNISSRCC